MKFLNGEELTEYVKGRQAHEVRALRQAWHIQPKLAIVLTGNDPISLADVRYKEQYGADILIEVAIHRVSKTELPDRVDQLNTDASVHGIVVLDSPDTVAPFSVIPEKDVEGLGEDAAFDGVLPVAVLWLLAGYNVDLQQGKKVVLMGADTPAGVHLRRMLEASEVLVSTIANPQEESAVLDDADILITATDTTSTLKPEMLKPGAIVVDAEGVHSLVVCALFQNVILAARQTIPAPS